MATATEFTVTLENRPGTLAELGETLGNAGVNIEGIQGMPCEGRGVIQFVTNDANAAGRALGAANIQSTLREVLLISVVDEPSVMGRVTRAMADADVNVDALYITMDARVVVGVSDIGKAQEVAQGLGVA